MLAWRRHGGYIWRAVSFSWLVLSARAELWCRVCAVQSLLAWAWWCSGIEVASGLVGALCRVTLVKCLLALWSQLCVLLQSVVNHTKWKMQCAMVDIVEVWFLVTCWVRLLSLPTGIVCNVCCISKWSWERYLPHRGMWVWNFCSRALSCCNSSCFLQLL